MYVQTTKSEINSRLMDMRSEISNHIRDSTIIEPDSIALAAVTDNGLAIIDCENGREVKTFEAEVNQTMQSIVESPDFPIVVVGTREGHILTYAVKLRKSKLRLIDAEIYLLSDNHVCQGGLDVILRNSDRTMNDFVAFNFERAIVFYCSFPTSETGAGETKVKCHFHVGVRIIDLAFGGNKIVCLGNPSNQYKVGKTGLGDKTGKSFFFMEIQGGEIVPLRALHLKNLHTGVCVNPKDFTFISMRVKDKKLVTRDLDGGEADEILHSPVSTAHKSTLQQILVFLEERVILTSSHDGMIQAFVDNEGERGNFSHWDTIPIFHHSQGGVYRTKLNLSTEMFAAVNKRGSLVVGTMPFDGKYRKKSTENAPSATSFPPWIEELTFKLHEKAGEQSLRQKSWLDVYEDNVVELDKKKISSKIESVTGELSSLKDQIRELLCINERLPDSEKIPSEEFELNFQEKARLQHDGNDAEANLKFELKAWQLARKRTGFKLRALVWDNMDVPSKTIKVTLEPQDGHRVRMKEHT